MKRFLIDLPTIELTVDQVWPDGDAPEDPTAEDVAEVITRRTGSVEDWLVWWNLTYDWRLTVCEPYGPHAEVKWR